MKLLLSRKSLNILSSLSFHVFHTSGITALCLPLQPFLEEELGFLGGHLHRQYTLKQTPHIRSFSVMEIPCGILIALFNFQVQEDTP